MANSSYDRVLNNIMNLPGTKEMVADLAAGYMNIVLHKVEGVTSYNYHEKTEVTSSIFRMHFACPSEHKYHFSFNSGDDPNLLGVVFHGLSKKSEERLKERVENVLDAVWKTKQCPTFNCKKDTVLEKFVTRLKKDSVALVNAETWKEKLLSIQSSAQQEGLLVEAEAEALRLKAQKNILEAMMPFKNVPDDLIRQVIDQYLYARVMET